MTRVLVVIPTLNEAERIARVIDSLSVDPGCGITARFVVADGGSTDGTIQIVQRLARHRQDLVLLPNPLRLQSAALNLAVQRYGSQADVLVRCDAHAEYPPAFVRRLVDSLERHDADAVVVPMDSVGKNCVQKSVAWISDTRVGSGGSAHRGGARSGFVDHGHHAAFRIDSFRRAGGYDETFSHNEDAELDCRQRDVGSRVWLDADIRLVYHPRDSLPALWRQYLNYGRGRAKTARRHPGSLRARQLLVPTHLCVSLLCMMLAPLVSPWLLLWPGSYLALLVLASLRILLKVGSPCALMAAPAAATMHTAWAVGFLVQALKRRPSVAFPGATPVRSSMLGVQRVVPAAARAGRDIVVHPMPVPHFNMGMGSFTDTVMEPLGPDFDGNRPSVASLPPAKSLNLRHWLGIAVLFAPLVGGTFLSKLSLPPFSAMGLAIGVLIPMFASLVGLMSGLLGVAPERLLVMGTMLSGLSLLQLLGMDAYSPGSLTMLAVLHLPYVLMAERLQIDTDKALKVLLAFATVLAVLGVMQFAAQYLVGPRRAFPIENYMPAEFVVDKFNKQGYLRWGLDIYRANGIFMLEPSFFSQLMALAIITELLTLNRIPRVSLYAVALLLSFSGTGLMMLGVLLPVLILQRQRWDLLLLAAALVALALVTSEVLQLDVFAERASEFGATDSSGFARFIGGFYMFDQFLWGHLDRTLFGMGAGAFQVYEPLTTYPVAGMALNKMVFEFGIVGALAYFGCIAWCVFRSGAPLLVKAAIAMTFMLSGNYIPFAHALTLSLLLWPRPVGERLPA